MIKIILPPHTKVAKKVEEEQLKSPEFIQEVREIQKMIHDGSFVSPGSRWNDCLAVAQPQISNNPYRYFVLNPAKTEVVKQYGGLVVINPRILSKDKLTRVMNPEGCLSFPYRPTKKVKRFAKIIIEYLVADDVKADGLVNLRKVASKELTNMSSFVALHELEHLNGKNIYS